jgi:AraC family transcriptional regulator
MNYYERIQKSIDYIENNIGNEITLEKISDEAMMSLSNFYRIFFSIVGYTVKEYIRLRRISLAAQELKDNRMKIIDIAHKFFYASPDSFSRAFKKATGSLPHEFRYPEKEFSFERIDIMETYFDVQDEDLLQKYPDIKVLKDLKPFFLASYIATSHTPEHDAFSVIKEWASNNGFLNGTMRYRIFGFDAPYSLQDDGVYGYEVWITVPDDYTIHDDRIVLKKFNGGLYAVTSATIATIVPTWDRFREWLKLSKYEMGIHQCLEEHLPFEDWEVFHSQEEVYIDLYMPLQEKRGI